MNIMHFWAKFCKKIRGSTVIESHIDRTAKVESGCQIVNSKMARHSFCGYDCTIINCSIGGFCSIASGITIGGARHPMEFVSTSPVFLSHKDSVKEKFSFHEYVYRKNTSIGNDVWIGEGAFIKAGVIIGDGAVVGMGSVVTKDVAPYSIVAGNPARLIRMRFDENTVLALLTSQWWNLSDEKLREAARYFNDIEAFIEFVRK